MKRQLSQIQLESRMKKEKLNFPQIFDDKIENGKFPLMRAAFYSAMATGGYITQHDFADRILAHYTANNPQIEIDQQHQSAVLARAKRAYPSFMRQYHFGFMLEKEFGFVLDNDLIDYNGFDYIVIDDGVAIGVEMSVKTSRADNWEKVKKERHPTPKGINVIRITASKEKNRRVGQFWVHSEDDIDAIKHVKAAYLSKIIHNYLESNPQGGDV